MGVLEPNSTSTPCSKTSFRASPMLRDICQADRPETFHRARHRLVRFGSPSPKGGGIHRDRHLMTFEFGPLGFSDRGDPQVIDYSPITSMYGAVHCSSQVVRRMPKLQANYNAGSSLTRQLRQSSLNSQRGQ